MENEASPHSGIVAAVPPQAWFGVSAVFHYLGPSFAVLLFPSVGVLGVAWMRIATAATIFAVWSNPWRTWRSANARTRWLLVLLGVALAIMNSSFYLALDRLPMSLAAAIEFIGTIGVALYGLRTLRNYAALALDVAGVAILINIKWSSEPVGLGWAFLNGALFVAHIVLGYRISESGAAGGIERLGAAMALAPDLRHANRLAADRQGLWQPLADRGRYRGRNLFLRDPLCLRPACHVPPASVEFRPAVSAATSLGDDHRRCGFSPVSECSGPDRDSTGDGRRGGSSPSGGVSGRSKTTAAK